MIGSVLILLFVVFWIGAAGWVGSILPDNGIVRLVYYVVAGIGWGLPVLPLMAWMAKDKEPPIR